MDTGAWFARTVPSDANHLAIREWLRQNRQPLITTDFVIDETLTLMRVRGERQRAIALGQAFFDGGVARIYYLTERAVQDAWRTFSHHEDKTWSFTDCTSKVVMEKLQITQALSFDHHFRQFGAASIVP
ncbi:MAG: PIN domain-containing protein [Anaerolineae bacterium]